MSLSTARRSSIRPVSQSFQGLDTKSSPVLSRRSKSPGGVAEFSIFSRKSSLSFSSRCTFSSSARMTAGTVVSTIRSTAWSICSSTFASAALSAFVWLATFACLRFQRSFIIAVATSNSCGCGWALLRMVANSPSITSRRIALP
ncbi:hypothetical protein [Methylobacterium sp. D54C]